MYMLRGNINNEDEDSMFHRNVTKYLQTTRRNISEGR